MKKIYLIATLALLVAFSKAQQKYEHVNQLWFGYYSSVKINSRFSVNSDFQGRTTNWNRQWLQVLGRTGLAYKFNDKFTFTLGFADFVYFGAGNKVTRNEYRPWGEVAMSDLFNSWKISHRIRIEHRNFDPVVNDALTGKISSNYRFRYKLEFQRLIWTKPDSERSLHLQLSNEIMVNAGKTIVYNYFDQNRTAVSLLYTLNRSFSFQLQYMNIFQQLSIGTTFDQINVIRFTIYHTINFRKNDSNATK